MKELDLSPIKEIDAGYSKIVEDLERSYKCDWDDKVHDSYSVFVKQVKKLTEEVRRICSRSELLKQEADALNIEKLMNEADALCREADAI